METKKLDPFGQRTVDKSIPLKNYYNEQVLVQA